MQDEKRIDLKSEIFTVLLWLIGELRQLYSYTELNPKYLEYLKLFKKLNLVGRKNSEHTNCREIKLIFLSRTHPLTLHRTQPLIMQRTQPDFKCKELNFLFFIQNSTTYFTNLNPFFFNYRELNFFARNSAV